MNVVIAIDSFKGSLTSIEAGNAAKEGILRVYPDAKVSVRPLADGGEGTVEALVSGMGGIIRTIKACDPLGRITDVSYGIVKEKKTAIIEMSAAAGITLVSKEERNPLNTTTYGVGEMIKDAVCEGCREFIIGIGGSATNDGGAGMLQALGFKLTNKEGRDISFGAKGLAELEKIDDLNVFEKLSECRFYVACDVVNPLCGENGCSRIYGPQKGACEEMIYNMDKWLEKFAALTKEKYPDSDKDMPGAGAAGGMGFALKSFLNASLLPGANLVIEKTGLESYIKDADVVITGEGKLDRQTVMGKGPGVVAQLSKKYKKPVIAFSGGVSKDAKECNKSGIDAFFPIVRGISTLDEAMDKKTASSNMADSAQQVFYLLEAVKNI